MTTETFLENFAHYLNAPNGISKLRELILQLAVQGKLVEQREDSESAHRLFERIKNKKKDLYNRGLIKKEKSIPRLDDTGKLFDLPASWEWVRLNDVCEYIQRGKGPKYIEVSNIPVVSQKCIQWSGFTLEPARFVNPNSLDKYGQERFLRTGDLLWNSTGTGTIGRVNVYNHEDNNFEKIVADSHVTVVRPIELNSRFVYCWLASPFVQNEIDNMSSGTTKQTELNTSTVKAHVIPIAPLEEQKRIVEKVDELMRLTDKLELEQTTQASVRLSLSKASFSALTESANAAEFSKNWQRVSQHFDELIKTPEDIKTLRQSILQLAVQGKLVEQKEEDGDAKELLEQIENQKRVLTSNGKIKWKKTSCVIDENEVSFDKPNSWLWVKLQQLTANVHYGYTASANEHLTDVRLLRITDIQNNRVNWETVPGCEIEAGKVSNYKLEDGDILIARTGGTIGKTYLVENVSLTSVFASYLIRAIPVAPMSPHYLKLFMESDTYWQQLYAKSMGTGQPNVNATSLKDLFVPLPPLAEQKRIVAKVDALMAFCDSLEALLLESEGTAEKLAGAVVRELAA